MGAWKEAFGVLRGTGHVPGMLWRSSREIVRAAASWMRAGQGSSGELFGRLVALCVAAYVLIYLTGGRTWLWHVYIVIWLAVCVGLAHHRKDLPWHAPEKPSLWRRLTARWSRWRGDDEHEDQTADNEDADGHEGPHDGSHTPENDHETVGERHQDTAPPGPAADDEAERARRIDLIRRHVEHRVAAAVQAGARGVRTADLLAEYQAAGHLTEWDEKQFRTMLNSINIPTRDQMHFKINGKKKNNPGIHVDDLAQAIGRAPEIPPHSLPETPPAGTRIQHPAPGLILLKSEVPSQARDGAA